MRRIMAMAAILVSLAGCSARPPLAAQVWEAGDPHTNHRFKGGTPALDYTQVVLWDDGSFVAVQRVSSSQFSSTRVRFSGRWQATSEGGVILKRGDQCWPLPPVPGGALPAASEYPCPVVFPPADLRRVYRYPAPATRPA